MLGALNKVWSRSESALEFCLIRCMSCFRSRSWTIVAEGVNEEMNVSKNFDTENWWRGADDLPKRLERRAIRVIAALAWLQSQAIKLTYLNRTPFPSLPSSSLQPTHGVQSDVCSCELAMHFARRRTQCLRYVFLTQSENQVRSCECLTTVALVDKHRLDLFISPTNH